MVDRVGAPYRVLLYQPGIRFIHLSNSKGLCLQHIAGLIPIQLYLDKLSSHHQLRTTSLSTNHIIKSFFEYHLILDSMPYCILLDNITLKQKLKIKSSIINTNNYLINIFPSFNLLYKELSPGFCLVNTFQNYFSFNIVD